MPCSCLVGLDRRTLGSDQLEGSSGNSQRISRVEFQHALLLSGCPVGLDRWTLLIGDPCSAGRDVNGSNIDGYYRYRIFLYFCLNTNRIQTVLVFAG